MIDESRLYLVAPARIASTDLARLVPELASAGVDAIQLREKEAEAGDVLRAGRPVLDACREAGVPFIVNDRPDVALALGADGVHLGQNDLPTWVGRAILRDGLIGRSTHSEEQIDAETTAHPRPDYIAVGPVFETPTKPGRPAVGLEPVRYAAGRVDLAWFAIGGIDLDNLGGLLDSGARRIVVVRAITEATDPVAAAGALRERLDEVPL